MVIPLCTTLTNAIAAFAIQTFTVRSGLDEMDDCVGEAAFDAFVWRNRRIPTY